MEHSNPPRKNQRSCKWGKIKASEEAASIGELEGQAVTRPNQDLLHQEQREVLRFLLYVALGGLLYLVASFVFASRDYALPE